MVCLRILIFVYLGVLIATAQRRQVGQRHMIVVSMPGTYQEYYNGTHAAIATFIRDLEAAAVGYDDLAIVYDESAESLFDFTDTSAFTCKINTGLDLWMRDFTPVVDNIQTQFRYRPDYLSAEDIQFNEQGMAEFYALIGVQPYRSSLILDGGNIIENGFDKAVVTRRVNSDNPGWTEAQILAELEYQTDRDVVLVDDPQDTTGHIDGMMSFTGRYNALVADCTWDSVAEPVLARFPNLNIQTLSCPQGSGNTGSGFTSAIDWFSNALVTYNSIYVPAFSDTAADNAAYEVYWNNSEQPNVVSIDTVDISHLGGSVRCMTWSMRGDMPIAGAIRSRCAPPTRAN